MHTALTISLLSPNGLEKGVVSGAWNGTTPPQVRRQYPDPSMSDDERDAIDQALLEAHALVVEHLGKRIRASV